jgi:dethiobiotin synthetase/adenosylmethionine--8-amino-7-oxononanoate aminotransferase
MFGCAVRRCLVGDKSDVHALITTNQHPALHPLKFHQVQALLHGHSYTAYPIGCAASFASLTILESAAANANMCAPGSLTSSSSSSSSSSSKQQQAAGTCQAAALPGGTPCAEPCGQLLPFWPDEAVDRISRHPAVEGVVAIGTVLAVELRQQQQFGGNCDGGARTAGDGGGGSGYLAKGSAGVVSALRARGVFGRPLGNTVYIMVTPTTVRVTCEKLLVELEGALDEHRQ